MYWIFCKLKKLQKCAFDFWQAQTACVYFFLQAKKAKKSWILFFQCKKVKKYVFNCLQVKKQKQKGQKRWI